MEQMEPDGHCVSAVREIIVQTGPERLRSLIAALDCNPLIRCLCIPQTIDRLYPKNWQMLIVTRSHFPDPITIPRIDTSNSISLAGSTGF